MRKRQGRGRTVRGTLLGTYAVLILLAFAALATAFSLIHGNRVRSEVLNTLSQQAQSMAAAADREIDQMRTMAMNIIYSTSLQDRLYLGSGFPPGWITRSRRTTWKQNPGTTGFPGRRRASFFSFPAGTKNCPST